MLRLFSILLLCFVWRRFVRTSCDESDRNLTAFQRGKHIYFRATRPLEAGDRLRVWYSPEYIQRLHGVSQESIDRNLDSGETQVCLSWTLWTITT